MGPVVGLAPLLVAATILLGGCSSPTPERRHDPAAAEELQSIVHAATSAAHEGYFAEATAELDRLEASVTAALSRGEITDARFEAIMIAIALVRADLESALAEIAAEPHEATASEKDGTTEPTPVDPPDATTDGTVADGTAGTAAEPGNGRGAPGEPGPPDDRGKRD